MAGGKEIKTKIASVKNTQKITAAMEMVAASKMRRARIKCSRRVPMLTASRPWFITWRARTPSTSTRS